MAVDVPLPHLDRFFDYAIPDDLAQQVTPGCRVRVRFAGRQRDGYVIDVLASSDSDRELAPLLKVVSPEPVLRPEIVGVVRAVADHYAGTFADVVRLAVPPRHGVTEQAAPPERPAPQPVEAAPTLNRYPHGSALLDALRDGRAPRATLALAPVAEPAGDWPAAMIEAAGATDVGPAARYRAFLAAARGGVRLVLGTRAAAFAPVADLGLIALYDDGDDSWADPRAPYPHARVVAALRSARQECGLLYLGYARTAEVQSLVEHDWLVPLQSPPASRREHCPLVRVAAATDWAAERDPAAHSRLPHEVFTAIRAGLAAGPVLVQVPRAGYLASLACARCRALARCPACAHPLAGERKGSGAGVVCRVCGVRPDWHCPECGGTELRAPRVGVQRTAEELGRAFPQTPVVQSSGEHRVAEVADEPALVLATPGAEPLAVGGYAAAVLLDADLLLARADLRAAEEALRRWLAAVALVRGAADDGTVVVVGDPAARAVQALVRLDAAGFAARELGDRAAPGFPPVTKLVSFEGGAEAVAEAVRFVQAETGVALLGPVAVGEGELRAMVRTPSAQGAALVAAAKALQARRTAHKDDGSLRVRVDPAVL